MEAATRITIDGVLDDWVGIPQRKPRTVRAESGRRAVLLVTAPMCDRLLVAFRPGAASSEASNDGWIVGLDAFGSLDVDVHVYVRPGEVLLHRGVGDWRPAKGSGVRVAVGADGAWELALPWGAIDATLGPLDPARSMEEHVRRRGWCLTSIYTTTEPAQLVADWRAPVLDAPRVREEFCQTVADAARTLGCTGIDALGGVPEEIPGFLRPKRQLSWFSEIDVGRKPGGSATSASRPAVALFVRRDGFDVSVEGVPSDSSPSAWKVGLKLGAAPRCAHVLRIDGTGASRWEGRDPFSCIQPHREDLTGRVVVQDGGRRLSVAWSTFCADDELAYFAGVRVTLDLSVQFDGSPSASPLRSANVIVPHVDQPDPSRHRWEEACRGQFPLQGTWIVGQGPLTGPTHEQSLAWDFSFVEAKVSTSDDVIPAYGRAGASFGAALEAPFISTIGLAFDKSEDAEGVEPNAIALVDLRGRGIRFGHLRKGSIKHKPGELVNRGVVVAEVGSSGAVGPHLHVDCWTGSKPVALILENVRVGLNVGEDDPWATTLKSWIPESGILVRRP